MTVKRLAGMSFALAVVLVLLFAQPAAAAQEGNDRVQFGGDIVVGEDEVVNGNVVTMGGNITVDGKVVGDVTAMGGWVKVGGEVLGNVTAFGNNVELDSTAVVSGSATSIGGQVQRAEGARVRGPVSGGRPVTPVFFPFSGLNLLFGILQGLAFAVLLFLAVVLAVAIFPVQVGVTERTIIQAPWPTVGVGLLTFVVLVVLSLPLACTCIGLPLAWLAYFIATLFGLAALSAIIGRRLLVALGNHTATYLVAVLVGAAVIWVVSIIPFFGGLALFVASLFAMGAVVLSRFGTIAPPFSWQGPRSTPPPAQ